MKNFVILSLTAMLVASPALAERSKTVTVDNEKVSGTKTVTRDGQGNVAMAGELTRKQDGATATRDYNRTRTEDGWTASGQQTDFKDRSSGFDYQRSRTETGFEASGTGYNRRGDEFDYSAYGIRGEDSRERGRNVTRNGTVVYDRLDTATRNEAGQIVRNSTVTRDPGFRPKKNFRPLKPGRNLKNRRGK
ncbi:hypothetical protein [Parasphingorhabdus sp.]|uniref:hypothetical protein n=1 Tax=Parasphingorhabdus sp. TaxID=2709688 RepID=UPI003C7127BB